ncbi:WASH complex subunit 3 [Trinorchestia longiramus]|nr:WASH complex subunit 3 [Trinorchestia longiramus]
MNAVKPDIPATSVNLEKVEALNPKRTLAFINHWIVHMVAFLNKFASVCEDKLSEVDAKLQRTEDTLAILEAKLASIPGLENMNVSSDTAAGAQTVLTHEVVQPSPASEEAARSVEDAHEEEAATAEPATDVIPISKDPDYAIFFKMVSVGVPPAAVKLKMSAQGLDPHLLDNPDAPSPFRARKKEMEPQSESEDDLSSWSE